MSYHHWDEEDYDYEEEGEDWNLYGVQMTSLLDDNPISDMWPVYAENYDSAIMMYQILLMIRENKT
jgi:hypothetical protein